VWMALSACSGKLTAGADQAASSSASVIPQVWTRGVGRAMLAGRLG
jgi:hypothetical protein